ncbi:MAG: general secretion pathway protein GspB [Geobacteraceae bacterium]|nr:general secretion pathway protein GspB [Geobacteraceae bacterium]
MSFILDALKKLEQEKAARKHGTVNISDEILRGGPNVRRKVKRGVPLSVVLAGLGLLLLAAAGIFFWQRHGADEPQAVALRAERPLPPAPSVSAEAQPQPAPVVQPVAPPVAVPEAVVSEPVAAPVERPDPMMAGQAALARTPEGRTNRAVRPVRPAMVNPNGRQRRQATVRSPAENTVREQPAQPYREVSGSGGSGLMVSGIAWQEKPSARRAVINGTLVEEGATVNGATVEEILPTRVRFSSGGRQFNVSISSPMTGR